MSKSKENYMEVTPILIKKNNGKYLSFHFDDNTKFNIL